jgi:hypothetical protein
MEIWRPAMNGTIMQLMTSGITVWITIVGTMAIF